MVGSALVAISRPYSTQDRDDGRSLVMVSWAVTDDGTRLSGSRTTSQMSTWLAYHSYRSVVDARAKVIAGYWCVRGKLQILEYGVSCWTQVIYHRPMVR